MSAGLLYCCENIRDDYKKPQIWLAFAGMLAGTMLVAYFYEQPGNFIAYSITLIFLILAVYTDIKSGIIPDMLIIIFLVAGIFTVPVNPSITWQESAIGFCRRPLSDCFPSSARELWAWVMLSCYQLPQ